MDMDSTVKGWLTRCEREGAHFAMIKTVRAIYDRVAVKSESDKTMVVEFPKRIKNIYRIVTEMVFVRDLIDIRYYRD